MNRRLDAEGGEASSLSSPKRLPGAVPLAPASGLAGAQGLVAPIAPEAPPAPKGPPAPPGPGPTSVDPATYPNAWRTRTFVLPSPEPTGVVSDGSKAGRISSILAGARALWPWLLAALLALLILFFVFDRKDREFGDLMSPVPSLAGDSDAASGPKPTHVLPGLGGVTMPALGPGDRPSKPVALLLVTDSNGNVFKREARKLSVWMAATQRPNSQMRVLSQSGGGWKMSPVVSASRFDSSTTGNGASMADADQWLNDPSHRRFKQVAITVGGGPVANASPRTDAVRVGLAHGAPVPSASSADPRRKGGLAAAMALRVARAANQVLARQPELRK